MKMHIHLRNTCLFGLENANYKYFQIEKKIQNKSSCAFKIDIKCKIHIYKNWVYFNQ